ncbi:MAG: tagatose 6-phosphate kinase [Pseudonocardiales bacterium]|nr:tagatose 6-phosphate kinase [Pseudonocardiales bacterium]
MSRVILTVCLNAAVDVTYSVSALVPGSSHRVSAVRARAGGKSVNVARVLRQLGEPAQLLGFAGGEAGDVLRRDLHDADIPAELVPTAEPTRRTVAVVDPLDATLFNEPGPIISADEWALLVGLFRRSVFDADLVVLSGSLPRGVPITAYADLVEIAHAAGVRSIVDADGAALGAALIARPYLVKPNAAELAALLGRQLDSLERIELAARELLSAGARNAVVSCGPDGLLAVTEHGHWRAVSPERIAGNPTGAGDSLVAALARGCSRTSADQDPGWPTVLADGVAISAAAVVVDVAGEIDVPTMHRLRPLVSTEERSST